MSGLNIYVTPKKYFPFSSTDYTLPPPTEKHKESTTQVKPSGHFDEDITDSFYNETLELGEVFSVRIPAPILRWHPAKQGTTSKFNCHLDKIFPELEKISDKTLDRLIKDMRNREE
jgi:hypothetical protein